jgi:GH25 family lysozyme M1 (1,4-beta-N-acetylmuramidase)
MSRRNSLVRYSLVRLSALVTTGALLAGALPATAIASARYDGAENHYAGSQITAVEGTRGSPSLSTVYGAQEQVLGHDVSGHQGPVDWAGAVGNGAKFVYIKATEGTGYQNPQFGQQYNGSYGVGMIRGAYHFARPDVSSGADQADYFVKHGGGWSNDGRTLPGALDAEYNPYGETCYNLDQRAMTNWIRDFSHTYQARTGRPPTIYTSTSWWKRCTGNSAEFGANPLWLARYNSQVGELPASWAAQAIWQFADAGTLPGDQNWFNGPQARLANLTRS